jgi:basic membrane protein A
MLAACGSDKKTTTPPAGSGSGSSSASAASGLKIGLAYDIGGRGDKSFNDAAAAGLDAAKTKYNLAASDVKELEAAQGEAEADKEARLTQLAENGYTSIIAVGFAYANAVKAVVPKYPDVKFAIIDDNSVQAPNLADLTFAEEQGSYLVGAIAALKSKKHHVGFIGGVNVALIQKFQAGFDAGAKAADPQVKIENKYLTQPPDFGGFNDPTKGETAANGIYDAGADVIFAAAGGSGSGVFKAAKAKGALAIGTDSDQYLTAAPDVKDVVISSMLKKVDVAVSKFIDSVKDGSFKAGNTIFDVKSGGIDYSTSGGKIDDIKAKVDVFKQKIIDGTITVPTKP